MSNKASFFFKQVQTDKTADLEVLKMPGKHNIDCIPENILFGVFYQTLNNWYLNEAL